MLSVLIADDDRLILENIASRIDWSALGYEIVGKAINGAQALTLLRERRPNLLIVDVVMPLMNGLAVVAAARAELPQTRVVVISSYEEFDYVKQAITLGAIGYVLKSELFSAPFIEKLRQIHMDISRDRDSRRTLARGVLEAYFSESDDAVGGPGFISDGLSDGEMYSRTHDFALFYEWTPLQLLRGAGTPYDVNMRRERLLALCDAQADIECSFFVNELLVVGVRAGSGTREGWQDLAGRLSGGFRREYSFVCTSGQRSLSMLRDEVLARMDALEYLRHFRPRPVQLLNTLPEGVRAERFDFVAMLDEQPDISKRLDDYFEKLSGAMDFGAADDFVKTFVLQAEMLGGFDTPQTEEIHFFDDAAALRLWCVDYYERCRSSARHKAVKQYSETVSRAVDYINRNFSDPELRAETIAQSCAISMSRLQVLFKKETEKTINEYMTDIRVREAALLLETTQMRVYEVAEAVGYSSSQYFSQVLLQRTGKKPLEFRRAAKK